MGTTVARTQTPPVELNSIQTPLMDFTEYFLINSRYIYRYIRDEKTNRKIGMLVAIRPENSTTVYVTYSLCKKEDKKFMNPYVGIKSALSRLMFDGAYPKVDSKFIQMFKKEHYINQLNSFMENQVFIYFKNASNFIVCDEIQIANYSATFEQETEIDPQQNTTPF